MSLLVDPKYASMQYKSILTRNQLERILGTVCIETDIFSIRDKKCFSETKVVKMKDDP